MINGFRLRLVYVVTMVVIAWPAVASEPQWRTVPKTVIPRMGSIDKIHRKLDMGT
jgi:hypothetical protein